MAKYVAVETHGAIRLIESDKACYTPAGWHKPYTYFTLDAINTPKKHPAQKRGALVHISGLTTHANNVRLVNEETCKEIDNIDAQILELKKERQSIIYENFLTFPLVQEGELQLSHEKSFATKQEADNTYNT
jgi:hypothetical protein